MGVPHDFERATAGVSAFALLWGGRCAGRAVLRRTASIVTAFVQLGGGPMVKGRAKLGPYDAESAAIAAAVAQLADSQLHRLMSDPDLCGYRWPSRFEMAGLTVCNIID